MNDHERVLERLEAAAEEQARPAIAQAEEQARVRLAAREEHLREQSREESELACTRAAAVALAWWMKLDDAKTVDRVDRELQAAEDARELVAHHSKKGGGY